MTASKEAVLRAAVRAGKINAQGFTHWDDGAAWECVSGFLRAAAEMGWEMKPRECTPRMEHAGYTDRNGMFSSASQWSAMFSAAPKLTD